MQARVTQLFFAVLSLVGVLLPFVASAHDEGYSDSQRGVQQEFRNSPYTNREHLRLQRSLRRNSRNYYDRYSYNNNGHFRNRWYGGRRHYGNRYGQGKNCRLPRWSYGSGNQYGPRYYGNDYYGFAQ